MFSKYALKKAWQSTRIYFLFAGVVFLLGLGLGFFPNPLQDQTRTAIHSIRSSAQFIDASSTPQWTAFILILTKNTFALFLSVVGGLIFGIFPLFILLFNGMVLGQIFSTLTNEGIYLGPIILKGILPHGIFELPALFLACAIGVKLGFTLILRWRQKLFKKQSHQLPFLTMLKQLVPLMILTVGFIVIAALIESTITYTLMK